MSGFNQLVTQLTGSSASLQTQIGNLISTATGAASQPAAPPGAAYPAIYAFGDSLTDAGNDYVLTAGQVPVSPPYSNGRFSDGPVWVQDLATNLGLPALKPSLSGGTDFAYGGATTGTTPAHATNPLDLPSQLQQFQAEVPHPVTGALYTVWIGANDLFDILGNSSVDQMASVNAAVANEMKFISGLVTDGAHNILVADVPSLGLTPGTLASGQASATHATALTNYYNAVLDANLTAYAFGDPGVHLTLLDTAGLLQQAASDPQAFGFTNTTGELWSGNFTSTSSGTLATTNPTAQAGYLFFDQLHPTAPAHALVAQAAMQALHVA